MITDMQNVIHENVTFTRLDSLSRHGISESNTIYCHIHDLFLLFLPEMREWSTVTHCLTAIYGQKTGFRTKQ